MDEELETKIGAVMCVHVDANAALSQLSYEPKSAIFQSKKLWKTDFWDIRFWGEITENQTSEWDENQRCGM